MCVLCSLRFGVLMGGLVERRRSRGIPRLRSVFIVFWCFNRKISVPPVHPVSLLFQVKLSSQVKGDLSYERLPSLPHLCFVFIAFWRFNQYRLVS